MADIRELEEHRVNVYGEIQHLLQVGTLKPEREWMVRLDYLYDRSETLIEIAKVWEAMRRPEDAKRAYRLAENEVVKLERMPDGPGVWLVEQAQFQPPTRTQLEDWLAHRGLRRWRPLPPKDA